MMSKKTLIYIGGPTASGKTSVAVEIAKYFSTEIISCDSRQFYKEMSIGTAIPNKKELLEIKHHFIQDRSVINHLSVGEYEIEAIKLIDTIFKKNNYVVLVGGSGLYADSIINGLDLIPKVSEENIKFVNDIYKKNGLYQIKKLLKIKDPVFYNKTDLNNPRRLIRALSVCLETNKPFSSFLGKLNSKRDFNCFIYILNDGREKLYDKINLRVDNMIKKGLEDEAKSLSKYMNLKPLNTVGYKEWISYWSSSCDKNSVIEEIKKNTRRYAKRQLTWFRRYKSAKWLETDASINSIINHHK